MKKIDINETLLQRLKTDYSDAEGQVKFTNGLDYLEAMVKLFAVVNIAVVKKIDTEIYQTIFLNNFKITPSLGDFKSLATHPFTKANKNVLITKNSFYKSLYDIFTTKDLDLRLDMADDIIEGNIKEPENKKKITTLRDLFDIYVVNFRNKLKGHGASFNGNDKEQSQIILDNLDTIINAIESKLQTLLKDPQLSFFVEKNEETSEEHEALKVFVKYDEIEYELSPLMIYLECHKFSCQNEHKVKLFFYNDGKASKSYYIDYSYNHYYYFSSNNEVDSTLSEIITYQKELNAHNTSDNLRQSNLLSVFVGREKELKDSKDHILENIASNTPSAITIKGKPGIGKSAFISKLQVELKEKSEVLQSYIFYVRKSEMSDDENKYFYNKFVSYLDSINISIPKVENDDQLTPKERLEHVFNTLNTVIKEPLLLVIDGLDEFANPVAFLQNFPMQNIPNKLHLVFSTRGYPNILEELQTKLFNSDFNLLNKDQYLSESISITLGKLSHYEVETLICEVLTKDVQRGTETYKTIQSEIYEKSEGLPLYIHYISNKLIEFNPKSSDIAKDIFKYAKELPQGLGDFYYQAFSKLKTISSELLYILYFSHKHIGFDSFYHLVTGLNGFIDKKEFQNSYFNEVEIFFTRDIENKYSFYHLSVKEAIKNYFMQEGKLQAIIEIDYDTFSNNMHIAPYQQEQYRSTFETYYYLKQDSDLFKVLKKTYTFLSDKQNDENLSELYNDNYLTYYYKYIHFSNYHEIVTFDKMFQKDYTKFENATLSYEIRSLIEGFFKAYELSPKQDITEIKYAHELAMLNEDYYRVLKYADDFSNTFLKIFINILWNLDKSENQKLFKKYKNTWESLYDDQFKLFLLQNKRISSFTKYSLEIANTIKDDWEKDKALVSIVKKTNDIEKALEIANAINGYQKKAEALVSIVEKTDDIEKALEIANAINSYRKTQALSSIVEKTDDIEKALEIANAINDDRRKAEALISIVDKTDDIEKALEIANAIEDNRKKAEALLSIVDKPDDIEKALKIANTIEDDRKKAEALSIIADKTDDIELLNKALEIANAIKNDREKVKALSIIADKTDDIEKVLEIANAIEYDREKAIALSIIADKTDDKELLNKALKIANAIKNDREKAIGLSIIAEKTNDIEKALEIANTIEDDREKAIVLSSIVEKTDEKELLNKVLEIANAINDDREKAIALSSIAEKTDDIEKALEIANAIEYDRYKAVALISIVDKTDDIEKALEIANTIEDDREKAEALVSIVEKTDDIEKALEIANTIEDYREKVKALSIIAEKTDDKELLNTALEIANAIYDDWEKAKALLIIADKTDDIEKALEIANTIKGDWEKAKALLIIADKTDDKEVMNKALEIANTIEKTNPRVEQFSHMVKNIIYEEKRDKNLSHMDEVWQRVLWMANTIEDEQEKAIALSIIADKTDDKELLNKALEIANAIEDDREKAEALLSIVKKTDDIEKALEIANTIEDDRKKVKALSIIAEKTDDIEKTLEIANMIEKTYKKAEALSIIVDKTDDKELLNTALEIANIIEHTWEKAQALVFIVDKTDDIEKALEIANTIEHDWYKAEALFFIVNKTDDIEKVLEIANTIEHESTRQKLLIHIKKKCSSLGSLENYLYKLNATLNFDLNKSVDYVVPYSSDAILRYYGILDAEETQKNDLENIILKLEELVNTDIDPKEKRTLFNTIKRQILDNESLLNEFISKFGDKLEIDDKDSFDDEFSLKTFEKNIELFKVKN